MYNFVVFSLSRWNVEFGCNIRDMSYELAKNHKVLYVDVPLKRKERWLKKDSAPVKEVQQRIETGDGLVQVSENLWHYIDFSMLESVNGINNSFLFDITNKVNNYRFAKALKRAIERVGFKEYILLNDNDIYNGLYVKNYLKPSLYVYYLRDRLSAMKYWARHVSRLEPSLIKSVDLVVANSQHLADDSKKYNKNSFYIGQGCDVSHFAKKPLRNERNFSLKEMKGPIIGYMGALNAERLDIDLLVQLALTMKDKNFVFIGQEDSAFVGSKLHQLPNVHFLGKRDFADLPAYLEAFDVTINPQVVNEITIGNYPRKVDEYLAAGKPVVATETPTMVPFSNYVYLGKSASDYEVLIKKALTEDSQERQQARKEFASAHTWPNSINAMLDHCKQMLHDK